MVLSASNFPGAGGDALQAELTAVQAEIKGDLLGTLGAWRRVLTDNTRSGEWTGLFNKLQTLFKCGAPVPMDGPMIGVTLSIRDSDFFRGAAKVLGENRSALANLEVLAHTWNATFGPTGLWMGKTFEPVDREVAAAGCGNDAATMAAFDPAVTRMGRNFFRQPTHPNFIQGLGVPVITDFWHLLDRPASPAAPGFRTTLTAANLDKEKVIPYSKTGGWFLANPGTSMVAEMNGKAVFQLNYRWPGLDPAFPMTTLVDEIVQVGEGIWLGQLVMATRHFSLGKLSVPLLGDKLGGIELGEAYTGGHASGLERLAGLVTGKGADAPVDYGYQNNGFFLMVDPALAKRVYADDVFPFLRPRPGEVGFDQLGYSPLAATPAAGVTDWVNGWKDVPDLAAKFTTFTLEPSPNPDDGDVRGLRQDGESVLQMLARIQKEITAATRDDDSLKHFDKLARLFRAGIAPTIKDGLFQGQGKGYNTRFDAPEPVEWYGKPEPIQGFDYYHGATLNLHFGLADTVCPERPAKPGFSAEGLAALLDGSRRSPDVLNEVWANIGRFIFPWAGKAFQKVSGRKLSMLLDESDDLASRYPARVGELKSHPASWPHYDLVQKNAEHYWDEPGTYAPHLASGPWDGTMSAADRAFWEKEAGERWIYGSNLQDARILPVDGVFHLLDMNYGPPPPSVQALADSGPSPFVREGYIFMGTSDRESIMPSNWGPGGKKKVFQFQYRYPMIGGAAPIGLCLDEIVEIAEGLYLGELIYSTALLTPFHSSTDPSVFKYQLFGYFLLMDNTWEYHRQAIGFDVDF